MKGKTFSVPPSFHAIKHPSSTFAYIDSLDSSAYVYYVSHAYWTASARNIFISCMSLTYV